MSLKRELAAYRDLGLELIPLRPRDKAPLKSAWNSIPYEGDEAIEQYVRQGHNIGVKIPPEVMVVDVDPRNFEDGVDSWERLRVDFGIDEFRYPIIETGAGGKHVLMRKPADIVISKTLPDYKGVDFKAYGTQIVAAGSIHHNGNVYRWLQTATVIPPAPERLIAAIRRPDYRALAGGAEYEPAELAEMLAGLDPVDFRDYDRWITLMFACHSATGGLGCEEFVGWSLRDGLYEGHQWKIRRHWDSARADRGITYRTLHKYLVDVGKEAFIIRRSAAQDFEGSLPEMDRLNAELSEAEQLGPLDVLNRKYWYLHGSKDRVFHWADDDGWQGIPQFVDLASFRARYGNATVKPEGAVRRIPLGEAWLKSPERRDCEGLIFDPSGREHKGKLNLWTGWACEPEQGDWGEMQWLIRHVLCDGDWRINDYVMNWMAYMVQFPSKIPEVALAFRGDKGTGKSTLGRALCQLAGRHGRHITSPMHLTGRFNSHLRDCLFLFADEAVHPTERHDQSILKGLISEPRIQIEAKGVDTIQVKNRLHVMMASNDTWFVPASDSERRFLVSRANDLVRQNVAFFGKLHEQMKRGGLAAMLYDLLKRDIEGWRPSGNLPSSKALEDQKMFGANHVQQWWWGKIESEVFDVQFAEEGMDWHKGPIKVFRDDLQRDFQEFLIRQGHSSSRGRQMTRGFNEIMKGICPSMEFGMKAQVPEGHLSVRPISDSGRAKIYQFPSYVDCKEQFSKGMKVDVERLLRSP